MSRYNDNTSAQILPASCPNPVPGVSMRINMPDLHALPIHRWLARSGVTHSSRPCRGLQARNLSRKRQPCHKKKSAYFERRFAGSQHSSPIGFGFGDCGTQDSRKVSRFAITKVSIASSVQSNADSIQALSWGKLSSPSLRFTGFTATCLYRMVAAHVLWTRYFETSALGEFLV